MACSATTVVAAVNSRCLSLTSNAVRLSCCCCSCALLFDRLVECMTDLLQRLCVFACLLICTSIASTIAAYALRTQSKACLFGRYWFGRFVVLAPSVYSFVRPSCVLSLLVRHSMFRGLILPRNLNLHFLSMLGPVPLNYGFSARRIPRFVRVTHDTRHLRICCARLRCMYRVLCVRGVFSPFHYWCAC